MGLKGTLTRAVRGLRLSRRAEGELLTSQGIEQLVALASMDADLSILGWVTSGGADTLVEQYRIPETAGASGLACWRTANDTFVAVASFYHHASASLSAESRLLVLEHTEGAVTGARQVQTFPVRAASGVEHMQINERHLLAFLTATALSASSTHTTVYEWTGISPLAAAARQGAPQLFKPLQHVQTPGGAFSLRLQTLSSGIHLMVAMHAPCNTLKSGLRPREGLAPDSPAAHGQCSAMLRWNGTMFTGPFIHQLTRLRDTASGQELPGSTLMRRLRSGNATSGRRDIHVSINFEEEVQVRSAFTEVGDRRSSTRNTRALLLVERSEELTCLGAPVALAMDGQDAGAGGRVLVLSYHHSAITVFDRCKTTGILTLTPNVSQCVPAVGLQAAGGEDMRSRRGAVAMALTRTPQGCYSNLAFTACVYVLDAGARPAASGTFNAGHADEATGAIHVLGLDSASGQLVLLTSFLSASPVAQVAPGAAVSRYVLGLGGARTLQVSSDERIMLVASGQMDAVTLLDREPETGVLSFGDMMTQGERMTWAWSSLLPGPSPSALPFTLPIPATATEVELDFKPDERASGITSPVTGEPLDPMGSMLEAPSRISGIAVGGVYHAESLRHGSALYLLAAAGDKGALLYKWDAAQERFGGGKQLSSSESTDAEEFAAGLDVNCVHVSVMSLPNRQGQDVTLALVANWVPRPAPAPSCLLPAAMQALPCRPTALPL